MRGRLGGRDQTVEIGILPQTFFLVLAHQALEIFWWAIRHHVFRVCPFGFALGKKLFDPGELFLVAGDVKVQEVARGARAAIEHHFGPAGGAGLAEPVGGLELCLGAGAVGLARVGINIACIRAKTQPEDAHKKSQSSGGNWPKTTD
jgi:hypothetical protein